jgi:hypothetical protein
MNPIEWLEARVPRFVELSNEERTAIQHFALLWSLFEGKVLRSQASAQKIISVVHDGVAKGTVQIGPYEACLNYFRTRYFADGEFTPHFRQLKLRNNDSGPLVEQVLRGENDDPADCISVVLIVIYRFRNNLFHGLKWEYELRGQRDNFNHANHVLMAAYDHC